MPSADRDKYFQKGEFLKAQHVKDNQQFTVEKFDEAQTMLGLRPLLRLVGIKLPFGLNATNFDKMVAKFGANTDKWKGKRIRLIYVQVANPTQGGKMTRGLRIE